MTMQLLLTQSDTSGRRRRPARTRHVAAHRPAEPHRRESGPSQDNALYNCGCGFVFQAAVTTSVDCPHCGGYQAW
jgi:hypothetical protein